MRYVSGATGELSVTTFLRYLKVQTFVFVCGMVGPIFLAVYFSTPPDPAMKWMYWAGLIITTAEVLIALALTSAAGRGPDRRVRGE